MKRILLWVAATMAATLSFALITSTEVFETAAWMFLGIALLAATVFLVNKARKQKTVVMPRLLLVALTALAAILFFRFYQNSFVLPLTAWDGQEITVVARAECYPEPTPYGQKLDARLTFPDGSEAKVRLYTSTVEIVPGDVSEMTVKLSVEDGYLRTSGIFLTATQRGEAQWGRPEAISLLTYPALWGHDISERLFALFPARYAGLLKGLLTGDTSDVPVDLQASLSETGLSHVTSVSGLHIAVIVGFFALVLGKSRWTLVLILPTLYLFVAMTGFPPSAVRAVIMETLVLLSLIFQRESDTLTSLSLAVIILLLQNPYAIADIGLQLSFGAALGITLFSNRWYRGFRRRYLAYAEAHWGSSTPQAPVGSAAHWVRWRDRAAHFVFASLSTTAGACFFSIPLTAIHFGTVPLLAPLVNLLVLWAVSVVFIGGALAVAFSFLWLPLGQMAVWVMTPFLWWIDTVSTLLGSIPALRVDNPYFAVWCVLAYAVLWLVALLPGRKRLLVPACGLTLSLMVSVYLPLLNAPLCTFAVLDVGQGQCIVVTQPGFTAVIDCGGNRFNPAQICFDYLRRLGRTKIDVLILTHYHDDHAGGVSELFELMPVETAVFPEISQTDDTDKDSLIVKAGEYASQIIMVHEDSTLGWNGAQYHLYASQTGGNENEQCMAVRLEVGGFDALVTGDLEQAQERTLLRWTDMDEVDALVAGHHGSKYATAPLLLETLKPQAAVISVGRNNYGHPTPETLTRLELSGAAVYRTDLSGTISIVVR